MKLGSPWSSVPVGIAFTFHGDITMHCFERTLMRDYLFDLVRELDPLAERDELKLEEMLGRHAMESLNDLMALGCSRMMALVRELSDRLPLAA